MSRVDAACLQPPRSDRSCGLRQLAVSQCVPPYAGDADGQHENISYMVS